MSWWAKSVAGTAEGAEQNSGSCPSARMSGGDPEKLQAAVVGGVTGSADSAADPQSCAQVKEKERLRCADRGLGVHALHSRNVLWLDGCELLMLR